MLTYEKSLNFNTNSKQDGYVDCIKESKNGSSQLAMKISLVTLEEHFIQ